MARKIEAIVDALHACADIESLKAEYERASQEVAGDAALTWAVQEATCARRDALNGEPEPEDYDDGPLDPTRAGGLYEVLS